MSEFIKYLKSEIRQMDAQTCIEIMHECAEQAGLLDIPQASNALGIERRAIYDRMDKGKLPFFTIGDHKYPCVNE